MNPGTWVMGGGAGGGGGSGNGKGGGGKGGADGGKGDGDPEGGDKGAGACGPGGNAACTNCAHSVSRGDPVDVVSGKVFTVPKTDLFLPGFFNLEILRSYSSARRNVDLGMGFGWAHTLAWSLEETRRSLIVQCGDGSRVEVPLLMEVGTQGIFGDWYISKGDGFYALMPGKEFVHLFSPVEPGSKEYRLDYILYRNRGRIALQYEAGRLVRAIDTAGRVILFGNTQEGRISSISVADTRGQNLVFARYYYDDAGHLVAATDADGHTTRYSYDDDHRLVRLEYPTGLVFRFVYDARDRCIETWGEYPGRVDPALAANLEPVLRDGTTRAKGIYHCRLDYVDDEYREVVDSVRLQRFFAGPDGKVAKAVGARGGVTSRTFDALGRVETQTDPTGATWTYEHDRWGQLTREIDPEGNTIQVTRDGVGRELEIIDAGGGVTTIGRDRFGEVQWVRDQNGATQWFERNARGLVTETLDRNGARHTFEWSDAGLCVARVFPNGARYTFGYDHWGRMLSMTDPLGAEHRFGYTNSGWMETRTDPLGQRSSFGYDSMGNRVRETQPDGSSIHYEYGGLNWLYRIVNADGSEINLRYNREGWPLFIENERGEKHEFEYEPDGTVAVERSVRGEETRFRHDELGRVVAIQRGELRRELKYSPNGLLIEEVSSDGAARRYEYNRRAELVRASTDDVDLTWQRDPTGVILAETFQFAGAQYEVRNSFTAAGAREALETSLGLRLAVRRDANGRVSELWNEGRRVMAIERDLRGLPVRRTLESGGSLLESYDALNRLQSRSVLDATRSSAQVGVGEPEWMGAGAGAHQWAFDYTPLNELSKVVSPDGRDVALEYDVRRHLKKRSTGADVEAFRTDESGNYYEAGSDVPGREYGKGDALVARGDVLYRYDDQGRLIEKTAPHAAAAETTRYEWNAWGFLGAVELPDRRRVEFVYDAFARRVAKRVTLDGAPVETRHYVWDRLSLVHDARVSATGNPEDVVSYLFEENDEVAPLGHRDGSGQWSYYVNDVNSTPSAIVDGAGTLLGTVERSAFGRAKPGAGSQRGTQFRFPGQYADTETGLHYNRYRYYDPEIGRYISPDPIGIAGGLNAYAYGPNPIGWSDPMGWYHVMQILQAPANFVPTNGHPYIIDPQNRRYRSGYTGTPCPDDLESNSGCHTEQKFCADLLAQHRARPGEDPFRDKRFRLQGRLPPCPVCHAAMMKAAEETGANITYQWENPAGQTHSVTYDGSGSSGHSSASPGVSVRGSGHGADLVRGYTHAPSPANPGPPQPGGGPSYGYDYTGSYNTYYDVSNR